MPQKKNPDVPELIRGKTGRVIGHLMALLTLMKGQPLAYNKDNQEDKEPLFDTIDTLHDVLTAMNGLIPAMRPNIAAMRKAANDGFATATDLADYLVRKDVPFRDAHEAVGRAVAYAIEQRKNLDELSLEELRRFGADSIDETVFDVLTLEGSVRARNHFGGTSPDQVRAAITRARERLQNS
jgi:argininosuccinate lyase